MLPSHLSRFMSVCLNGDYKDAKVREQIKMVGDAASLHALLSA